jgi:uncharacterized protein
LSAPQTSSPEPLHPRAAELVATLGLQPHPEGGWYAEVFRSSHMVGTDDGRAPRVALTTIDFLLARGQFSAWHEVLSDEVWHLLEGDGLRLWLAPPDASAFSCVDLGPADATQRPRAEGELARRPRAEGELARRPRAEGELARRPRAVVPAGWWQAAEPLGDYAYAGATVGPGFDFADFRFGREDTPLKQALAAHAAQAADLQRLL